MNFLQPWSQFSSLPVEANYEHDKQNIFQMNKKTWKQEQENTMANISILFFIAIALNKLVGSYGTLRKIGKYTQYYFYCVKTTLLTWAGPPRDPKW